MRRTWRGGRRNSDWINRPAGAWRQLEQGQSPWRLWMAKVPVPAFLADRQPRRAWDPRRHGRAADI